MKDGKLRGTIKWVARAIYQVELSLFRSRLLRAGDTPYELGGKCELCARCCEAPALSPTWPVRRLRSLRAIFLWWQRTINGFELVREEKAKQMFVFRCSHFDLKTRRCDSYETRPGVCRDYPRSLMWQKTPEMLPGCGYRPIAPGASSMLRELQKHKLTEEQMEKLKRGLFLE